MSATISGLIALENPTPLEESPLTLSFDGQMWLAQDHILTSAFRYYNVSNQDFPDVGQYFAWIHVHFTPSYFFTLTSLFLDCQIRNSRSISSYKTTRTQYREQSDWEEYVNRGRHYKQQRFIANSARHRNHSRHWQHNTRSYSHALSTLTTVLHYV